jgi:NADPH2:quinone reductase
MRAILLREFGPPDNLRLEELPDPQPGEGQLLIDVAVAGVIFVDTMSRRGPGAGSPVAFTLPYVPGNEVGGVVRAVGAGVDPSWVGRSIVARLSGTGGYAERAVVDEAAAIPAPDGLSLENAVAVLVNGRTAVGLMHEAAIVSEERVLIEAAAGGVGSLLLQLARRAGASQVIAAARGADKLDLARRLGADVAVDYSEPDWAETVRAATDGNGVDVVFDSVGGSIGRASFDLLRGGGRFIISGFSSGEPFEVTNMNVMRRGATIVGYGLPRVLGRGIDLRALTEEALRIAATGELTPLIGQTFPLERAADAHRAIESRETTGKTLLIP